MKNSQIMKDLRLLSTLLPHSWSIMCASSSTRPAVSTATSTFPPPLKWQKCKGGFFQCIILSFNHSEECLRVNVNPQFDQRGQVKHHRQVARPKSVLCSLDFLKSNLQVSHLPERGENVGHQLLISQSSPLLGVCCVEGVRDEQAAMVVIIVVRCNSNCFKLKAEKSVLDMVFPYGHSPGAAQG